MVEDSDYVGLLPKTFLVEEARVIGNETIGEVLQIPVEPIGVPTDIGAWVRHFAQFVSKREAHTMDNFDSILYKLQNDKGMTNYVLRVREPRGKETKPIAIIQKTTDCPHKGIFQAYLQEINPSQK